MAARSRKNAKTTKKASSKDNNRRTAGSKGRSAKGAAQELSLIHISFAFEVSIRLNTVAVAFAPDGVLQNRKFFLEITNGLMLLSAAWLLHGSLPSSRNARSASSWFWL